MRRVTIAVGMIAVFAAAAVAAPLTKGRALAIMVDILNPERIVIGGMALRLGNLLLEPALEVMHRESLPQSAAACRVMPARLGERIGDISALCVAEGASRPIQTAKV